MFGIGFSISINSHERETIQIKHVEKTSRDFFYLNLQDSVEPVEIEGFVGGEHINHYRVLGFAEDAFVIEVKSNSGQAYSSIHGEGIETADIDGKTAVAVTNDGIWIDIAVSASTFTSRYIITINRVYLP